jgi:hypothetical protein
MRRLLAILATLIAAGACTSGTLLEPDSIGFTVSDAPASGTIPRLEATAVGHTVELRGAIPANLCGSIVRPEARRESRKLTLTLHIDPRPSDDVARCPTSARMLQYAATVSDVPAGTFEVEAYWVRQLTDVPERAGTVQVAVR